ncbi:hypothetical protein GPJ56_007442 [Histomonas meleagridis]|uniref:uncharacterized protein n=1 Tax=Histomonas meleagridis TaxID=135588 RepID=UPI00355A710A|nr:hypothetical protein GPJ56_007442 [Histomonas meleagridis]KAH0804288.1 hypothetical protein GO595_003118 [Histomonas meleagridis]
MFADVLHVFFFVGHLIFKVVENWLDQKALAALNKQHKFEIDDVDIDVEVNDEEPIPKYDPSRIHIQLPGTTKFASLEYVTPKEIPEGGESLGSAAEPQFIYPKEKFDIFEHFNISWIPVPELE